MGEANAAAGTGEKLYGLLDQRLKEYGDTLPCTIDALRVYASEGRADIDYRKLMELDNQSLFDVCYCLSFNIYPPQHYLDMWKKDIETLPKGEFHEKFLNSFVRLPDFSRFHVRLRNCVCLRPGDPKNFFNKLYDWLFLHFHTAYMHLPKWFRWFLKRITQPIFMR